MEWGRLSDKLDEAGCSLSRPDEVRRWREGEVGAIVEVGFCGSDERFALCSARAMALTFFLPVYQSQRHVRLSSDFIPR